MNTLTSSLVVASYIPNQNCSSPRTSSFWTQRRCLLAISWWWRCWWKVCCRIHLWHGSKGRDCYCNWIQAHSNMPVLLWFCQFGDFARSRYRWGFFIDSSAYFHLTSTGQNLLEISRVQCAIDIPSLPIPHGSRMLPEGTTWCLLKVCVRLERTNEKVGTCSAAKGWSVYFGKDRGMV